MIINYYIYIRGKENENTFSFRLFYKYDALMNGSALAVSICQVRSGDEREHEWNSVSCLPLLFICAAYCHA